MKKSLEQAVLGNWRLPGEWQQKKAVWVAWKEDVANFQTVGKRVGARLKQNDGQKIFAQAREEFFHFINLLLSDLPVRFLLSKGDYYLLRNLYLSGGFPELALLFGSNVVLPSTKNISEEERGDNANEKVVNNNKHTLHIFFHELNDIWLRDSGPLFFGGNRVTVCSFNGWGGKYAHNHDEKVGEFIAKEELQISELFDGNKSFSTRPYKGGYNAKDNGVASIKRSNFVCEGGGIESNGVSVLLSTESVCTAEGRGSLLRRESILELQKLFGLPVVLLRGGLEGDDTGGHVDNVARFSKTSLLLLQAETDAKDNEALCLRENWNIVKRELPSIKPIAVQRIPFNNRQVGAEGMSHLNFFIGASMVFVPCFVSKPKIYSIFDPTARHDKKRKLSFLLFFLLFGKFFRRVVPRVKKIFSKDTPENNSGDNKTDSYDVTPSKKNGSFKTSRSLLVGTLVGGGTTKHNDLRLDDSAAAIDTFKDAKPVREVFEADAKMLIQIEIENIEILRVAFPHLAVCSVSWRAGIFGGGGLHCLSQPVIC